MKDLRATILLASLLTVFVYSNSALADQGGGRNCYHPGSRHSMMCETPPNRGDQGNRGQQPEPEGQPRQNNQSQYPTSPRPQPNPQASRGATRGDLESIRREALKILDAAERREPRERDFSSVYSDLQVAPFLQGNDYHCHRAPNPSFPQLGKGPSAYTPIGAGRGGPIYICKAYEIDAYMLIHEASHLVGREECAADAIAIKAMFYGAGQVIHAGYDKVCSKNVQLEQMLRSGRNQSFASNGRN